MKKTLFMLFAYICCLILLTGVTYAWLVSQYKASTVAKVHPPTLITIQGPNESALQSIDLSYDKSEVDKDGNVSVKRPLVIKSEEKYFDLCIAHTTNVNQLEISLYEAVDGEAGNSYLAGITSNGETYFWNKKDGEKAVNIFNTGRYLNKDSTVDNVVADKSLHENTFSSYEHVQVNAEPLYWVKKGLQGEPKEVAYYKNYILEVNWNETDKETDVLYVIAQTSGNVGG